MKKALSLILFAILAAALSATAFAAEIVASGYCGGEGDGTNLEWKIDSDGVITISGEGPMEDYPYSHYIAWYKNKEDITEIIIEDGVTYIGKYAFYNCTGTKCTIGKDVASIGEQSFINCKVDEYYFKGDAPTVVPGNSPYLSFEVLKDTLYYPEGNETWKVRYNKWGEYRAKSYIPLIASGYCGGEGDGTNLEWTLTADGVLTISGEGKMADYGDFGETYMEDAPWVEYKDKIKSLVLEEGITYIGGCAFYQDPLNQYISDQLVIPESVTGIGIGAFAYGRNFTGDIFIPENVESIGHMAFVEIGAESFTVSENNKYFDSYDGILCSKDMKKIITCPTRKTGELVIPESVTIIEFGAFRFCEKLTGNLELPKNLQEIRGYVFYGCSGLEGKLDIPKGIKRLGSLDFAECGIDEYYFYGDAPSGVVGIGKGQITFDADDTIYYPAGNDTWEIVDGKWYGYTAIPYGEETVLYGDLTGDGKINVLDANLVRRYAAKLVELDENQLKAADVNGDGKINVLDANLIRRYAAKLIDKFPVEE